MKNISRLGIKGKLALWRALAAAAEARLQGTDFERLSPRAKGQRRKFEAVRLQVAKQALAPAFQFPLTPILYLLYF